MVVAQSASAVLISGLTFAFLISGRQNWPVALVSPVAVGGAICGFGALSDRYESSCLVTIAASAVGALLAVTLAYQLGPMGLILAMGSWVALQPGAGMFAWHRSKRPRPGLLAPPAPPAAPPPRPTARDLRIPGQLTTTLVAFSF